MPSSRHSRHQVLLQTVSAFPCRFRSVALKPLSHLLCTWIETQTRVPCFLPLVGSSACFGRNSKSGFPLIASHVGGTNSLYIRVSQLSRSNPINQREKGC